MTFTYDLTTDVGRLRLKIGDTVSGSGPRPGSGSSSNFSDEELDYFLSVENSVGAASAAAFEVLAAEWTTYTNITLGPRREEFARIAEGFAARATEARKRYGSSGSTFSVSWDRRDGYTDEQQELQ